VLIENASGKRRILRSQRCLSSSSTCDNCVLKSQNQEGVNAFNKHAAPAWDLPRLMRAEFVSDGAQ